MTQNDPKQAVAVLASCILATVEEFGEASSGVVFAALSQYGVTLSVYQSLLEVMQKHGMITVRNNVIRPGKGTNNGNKS